MAKILNFGSLNIDYVYTVDTFVKPGETKASLSRQIFAGGKGLNQSIAAAKAGGDVYQAGAVGALDSEILLEELAKNGISDEFVQRRDLSSGHTIIQVDQKGQNCILLFSGANNSITHDDIDNTLDHFNPGDYLVLQNEINNIDYLINRGAEKKLKICFNVSPFTPELLQLPLNKCSFLIFNEIEGAAIISKNPDLSPYVLIEQLALKFPNSSLVLTLGSQGSILKEINQEPVYCKSFTVDAVDTTAAGDTFLGYFITSISRNIAGALALKTASAAAALAVTRKGASSSIPTIAEVNDFLLEHGETIC